ncbi:amino acid adenylation protein [Micromonospora rosaria]|uniref:Amino acid adenylation protein n=1 Tax=Micromonospora rosaria TaxID=47874 RepID=A0A136PXD3_9ACTN|nr:amino acid adenylation protein [Micromonospora rosaria]
MHEAVARFAADRPDHPALQTHTGPVTYRDLDAWAGRIVADLTAAGVGRGARVGVLTEPSPAMVAAVVGILRCGAAYVPVDASWPDRRIADVLTDARVAAVVTGDDGDAARLGAPTVPVVPAGTAPPAGTTPPAGPAGPVAAGGVGGPVHGDDAAYLIYTSGSTGEPKGVRVNHAHLAAATLARRLVYPGAPVFLLVSPLAFDSSVAGLWGTLTAGGTLVVAGRDEVRDAERLVDLIRRHGVTQTLCVPSLYGVLLDAADRAGGDALATLETVVVAGEPLPQPLVDRHFARPGAGALVNEYGPTEATVWCTYHRLTAPGPVSIGRPVPGTRIYLLDDDGRPVPMGDEGEIHVGGAGVSAGYVGRPDATARAFLPDPFVADGSALMYRTGDRARWNPDGTLHFVGRRDHQVKIRGHRIELGAVESALRAVPGVRDAVVVPDTGYATLVGFVQADAGTDAETVRRDLAGRLPGAWVPGRIRLLAHFPLTFSGKVDREQLRAAADEPEPGPRPAAPAAPAATGPTATAAVASAWAEVLKVGEIPADANFFDLGGHSLAMFQLQDALERHTGVRPSVVALFQHPTVQAQADLIGSGGSRAGRGRPDRSQAVARRAQAVARRTQAVRARRQAATRERA